MNQFSVWTTVERFFRYISFNDLGASNIKPRCLSEQPTENTSPNNIEDDPDKDAPERKRQRIDQSPPESTISSV